MLKALWPGQSAFKISMKALSKTTPTVPTSRAQIREMIKLLRELSLSGLESPSPSDLRRNLQNILELSEQLLDSLQVMEVDQGTPRANCPVISVCGFVLNREKEILFIRRKKDGKWTLPGVHPRENESPREATLRAIRRETGLEAVTHRCLALFNARSHPHPNLDFNAYTLVFECRITGGRLVPGGSVLDAAFFPLTGLPELSTETVLSSQIYMLYSLSAQKNLLTYSD